MPGNTDPVSRSFVIRLSRNSSFTRRLRRRCSENGLCRNSPRVRGRLMTGTPHYYSEADYTLWRCLPCQWPLKQACSQEFFTPEFSMRGFARGRDEKCKRKEPAESAN